ncbi:hypothetical protein A2U01_0024307, partial [Trifolium medium]|nr:hypothetical protein [Trifolium medium]
MFVDFNRGFKERYYVVKPVTQLALDSLYRNELVIEQGVEEVRSVARFPLSWSRKHFEKSTDSYLTKEETMTPEDKAGFEALKAFVKGFQPARWETKAGVPVLDEQGNEQYSRRFINTKELLDSKNAAEAKICLDNMTSFVERMLKLAADDKVTKKSKKNKGRAGVILDQSRSAPGSSSSPRGGHVSSSAAGAQVSPSMVKEPPQKMPRKEDLMVDMTAPRSRSCSPPVS